MMAERIALTDELRSQMKAHAGETYPEECCGVIFGITTDEGTAVIRDVVQIMNHDGRKNKHYEINPLELFSYEKAQREIGNDILGFYHSHPDQPSIPSDEDMREMISEMVYLIISVPEGKPARLRAWKKDKSFGHVQELMIFQSEPY